MPVLAPKKQARRAKDSGTSLGGNSDSARLTLYVGYTVPAHSRVSTPPAPLWTPADHLRNRWLHSAPAERSWEEHHQGNRFGWIIGGILTLVGITLAGGYAWFRWRRIRVMKRTVVNVSETEVGRNSRPSVDLAPLLPSPSHWTPALPRISEHTEELSGSTHHTQEPYTQPSTSHYSRLLRSSEEVSRPLMPAGSSRPPDAIHESDERDNESASPTPPSEEHYGSPVAHSLGSISTERNFSLPQASGSPQGAEPRTYDPPRAPFQAQGTHPFSRDSELDTPTVSASDSDSMQVNIPWRSSARFIPARTQSLPMESEVPDTPSTPGIQSYYFPQTPLPALSPLHLRAVTEEEQERSQDHEHHHEQSPQSATKPYSVSSDSLDDAISMDPSEGSNTSLSSLAKLKLRFTGSAPFLPLIEESSPLDTEGLFRRLNGDGSARSSMVSKKSGRSTKPRPSSKRASSKRSSSKSSSSNPSLSAFPMTPIHPPMSLKAPSPTSSPKAISEPTSLPFHLTPQMDGPPSLTTLNSSFHSSPPRSQSPPFPLSSAGAISEASASSFAHPSSEPFPEPPSPPPGPLPAARQVPPIRPLPIRPLPTIPPPCPNPSVFSYNPPITIPNDVESDLGIDVSVGPSPKTPQGINSPIASSEEGYAVSSRHFSPGPSKLAT